MNPTNYQPFSLARFSVERSVLVNILALTAVIAGLASYFQISREMLPSMPFHGAGIYTVYPGAGPKEVERLVTRPIEDAIKDVKGIKKYRSTSREGFSSVVVEFDEDLEDIQKAVLELTNEIGRIQDLPQEAEKPIVRRFHVEFPVIILGLIGKGVSEGTLRSVSRMLERRLREMRGVGQLRWGGDREREILIEVDPRRMEAHQLTLGAVLLALKAANLNVPGGPLQVGKRTYLVRTVGELKTLEQIRRVVVLRHPKGRHVTLGQIAGVRRHFARQEERVRINGKLARVLLVRKQKEADIIEIAGRIRQLVREFRQKVPSGVQLLWFNDASVNVRRSLGDLFYNGLMGLALVLVVLWLFLGIRESVLVALGLLVALLAAFWLMHFLEITLSMVSLFSLILVLGILVDDGIVIVENISRHLEMGKGPFQAAIEGTQEVLAPVVSSVSTTIAAFVPLMMMTGIMGKFFALIPKVVIAALAASLAEALLVLPSHMSEFARPRLRPPLADRFFMPSLRRIYRASLRRVIRHPFLTVGLVLVLVAGSVWLALRMPLILLADEDIRKFDVRIRAPAGSSLAQTDRILQQIEKKARSLPRREVQAVITRVGFTRTRMGRERGDHLGMVTVVLVPSHQRQRRGITILNELRKQLHLVTGAVSLDFAKVALGPPVGKPVGVRIKGDDYATLKRISLRIQNYLATIQGVKSISDDYYPGKPEFRIKVRNDRAALFGLSPHQVARYVRLALEGGIATRLREGDEEIDVRVRYARSFLKEPADLGRIRISLQKGRSITLREIVRIEQGRSTTQLRHIDGKRAITVTADIDETVTTSAGVNRQLQHHFRDIDRLYPGYRLEYGGEWEETRKTILSLFRAFIVAFFLIYAILGAQFRSYTQPLIVLSAVPMSFVGVIVGLWSMGKALGMVSLIGVVALAGIVVNNALILVDFINARRQGGLSREEAILEAGELRMRPVLLTSITTVVGLFPTAMGLGGESLMLSPMAISVSWGLFFATPLTLYVVPSLYVIIGLVRERLGGVTLLPPKPL